tara:strand:+ start:1238 stop:1462 length:225 start_codon:yes stop_codon:yes gene_type:complete
MSLNLPEPKKPASVWELKQIIELIDERMTELRRHRGENACGDYIWDSDKAKAEYIKLHGQRIAIRKKILDVKLD